MAELLLLCEYIVTAGASNSATGRSRLGVAFRDDYLLIDVPNVDWW